MIAFYNIGRSNRTTYIGLVEQLSRCLSNRFGAVGSDALRQQAAKRLQIAMTQSRTVVNPTRQSKLEYSNDLRTIYLKHLAVFTGCWLSVHYVAAPCEQVEDNIKDN